MHRQIWRLVVRNGLTQTTSRSSSSLRCLSADAGSPTCSRAAITSWPRIFDGSLEGQVKACLSEMDKHFSTSPDNGLPMKLENASASSLVGNLSGCRRLSRYEPSIGIGLIQSSIYAVYPSQHFRTLSTSSTGEEKENIAPPNTAKSPPKSLDDFQHEEIVGPTVERDMSTVANELREALGELKASVGTLAKVLAGVGAIQIIWPLSIYLIMEPQIAGALLTQMVIVGALPFWLAYNLLQTVKPMDFFAKLEGRSRLRILTLSLQIIKALKAFFERGYGGALVVSVGSSLCLVYFLSGQIL